MLADGPTSSRSLRSARMQARACLRRATRRCQWQLCRASGTLRGAGKPRRPPGLVGGVPVVAVMAGVVGRLLTDRLQNALSAVAREIGAEAVGHAVEQWRALVDEAREPGDRAGDSLPPGLPDRAQALVSAQVRALV